MASKKVSFDNVEYDLNYEILNPKENKCILFLHGWGANKELMKNCFCNELTKFCHIYIDLPGFGSSSIKKPLTTYDYANIIAAFITSIDKNIKVILGHSFGAKVATLLSLNFNLSLDALVLLSSAGIPKQKPFLLRAKIKIFKILKYFGFARFYTLFASKDVKGMSKTMYETLKLVVDDDFSRNFASIDTKTFIFWGSDDDATPLKSGQIMHSLIKNSTFFTLKGDHFFFMKHHQFISQEIESKIGSK